MDLLCLACGAIGPYGPGAAFRPVGDVEVWCMACGDTLSDRIPVVSGDYDCPPDVDRYVYMGHPSGAVVLLARTAPPHPYGYWKATDLTGRKPPYGIARSGEPIRPW